MDPCGFGLVQSLLIATHGIPSHKALHVLIIQSEQELNVFKMP